MSSKHHQQIIYNQQVYTNPSQGASFGTYQATNYNQPKKKTSKEVVYQTQYVEQPPQYIVEGETYDPQVQYVQEGEYITQDNQNIVYEYQQPEGQVITGYEEQYIDQQQPQQVIYQDENGQQYQEVYDTDEQIYQQQLQQQQLQQQQLQQQQLQQQQQQKRKAKYTNQMIQQKQNVKQKQIYQQQYQQQDYVSRNPNYQQKYQNQKNQPQQQIYYQNISSQNYNIVQPQTKPQKQVQVPKQMVQQEKPLIESQFAPEFQLANSVIDQSQIPFDQNQINYQMQQKAPYQNQNQKQNYMIPRRNPNIGVKKYEITSSNHYVNTNDPGYKTNYTKNINNTGMNSNANNISQTQNQSQNKGTSLNRNIYEEQNMQNQNNIITEQNLNKNIAQLMNKDGQLEVGEGISCLGNSSIVDNNQNNNINVNNQSNINPNPNISNINPNISNTNPNISNINPNISNTNPNISNINPNISNTNTNISNINNNTSNMNNISKVSNTGNLSNINDIKNNEVVNSINMNENNNYNGNNNENQVNLEEVEQEKPIEEKIPDEINMENPKNFTQENYEKYQPHYSAQEVHESKLKESVDIDATMETLPTITEIMKGLREMLPPPKKRKYEE